MSTPEIQQKKEPPDVSTAAALFPDAKTVFGVRLKPLNEIKGDCFVVLDTNVLLVPYTINPKGLSEIANTYDKLVKAKRLVIPGQVAREFAKNRPDKLTELYQQLSSKRSRVTPFQGGQYPLLVGLPEYNDVVDLERALNEQIANYKTALSKVLDHVRGWTWNDPVSLLYGNLFSPDTVIEAEISAPDLQADIKRRLQHKIPPGYKDAAKDDSGAGDIIIWHTILELGRRTKKSVIFVSADGKPDWFHQSDGPLYPRFELVDEFRRNADSASFHILKLSDFLDLFGAEVEVIQEVRQEEAKLTPSIVQGSTERARREHIAESAILDWLTAKSPNYRSFPANVDGGLDYLLISETGEVVGVVVKVVRNTAERLRRIREVTTIAKTLPDYGSGDVWIIIVMDDQEAAQSLDNVLNRRKQETGSLRMTIGWLDNLSFLELSTFRFD